MYILLHAVYTFLSFHRLYRRVSTSSRQYQLNSVEKYDYDYDGKCSGLGNGKHSGVFSSFLLFFFLLNLRYEWEYYWRFHFSVKIFAFTNTVFHIRYTYIPRMEIGMHTLVVDVGRRIVYCMMYTYIYIPCHMNILFLMTVHVLDTGTFCVYCVRTYCKLNGQTNFSFE